MVDDVLRRQRAAGRGVTGHRIVGNRRSGEVSVVEVAWTMGGREYRHTFYGREGRLSCCRGIVSTYTPSGTGLTVEGVRAGNAMAASIGTYEVAAEHELTILRVDGLPSGRRVVVDAAPDGHWPLVSLAVDPSRWPAIEAAVHAHLDRCRRDGTCPGPSEDVTSSQDAPFEQQILGPDLYIRMPLTVGRRADSLVATVRVEGDAIAVQSLRRD